jgi:hypothetical protein
VCHSVRLQCPNRLHRQVQGVRLIQPHALRGGGESATTVEAGGIENLVARLRPGLEDGVAMLDVSQAGHAVEQRAFVPVRERVAAELDEGGVDVVGRDRCGNAVEPSLIHGRSLVRSRRM